MSEGEDGSGRDGGGVPSARVYLVEYGNFNRIELQRACFSAVHRDKDYGMFHLHPTARLVVSLSLLVRVDSRLPEYSDSTVQFIG